MSSTTPRLGPRWPPFSEVTSMILLRISVAKVESDSTESSLMSSGPLIAFNIIWYL